MNEEDKELLQIIICHWIMTKNEIPAGAYDNDAKIILSEEGADLHTPIGLMCLGFAAGMHHGLEIARQMNECKRVQDAGDQSNEETENKRDLVKCRELLEICETAIKRLEELPEEQRAEFLTDIIATAKTTAQIAMNATDGILDAEE